MRTKLSQVWIFVAITFAVSWLMWVPSALTGQDNKTFPTALMYMLGGSIPSIVAMVIAWRARTGEASALWKRTIDVKRVSLGGYATALLIPPAVAGVSILINRLAGGPAPVFTMLGVVAAQPAQLIGLIVLGIIAGPLSEEIGWRGYMLDRLLARWSPLACSLVIGLVWWAWHLPLFFIRGTLHYEWGFGGLGFWAFLLTVFPLSALMTMVVTRNRGSILAAVLLHFSFNFTVSLLYPLNPTIFMIQAVVYLAAAAALALANRQAFTAPAGLPTSSD